MFTIVNPIMPRWFGLLLKEKMFIGARHTKINNRESASKHQTNNKGESPEGLLIAVQNLISIKKLQPPIFLFPYRNYLEFFNIVLSGFLNSCTYSEISFMISNSVCYIN